MGFQESHLQEAILAQQACTSGIKVENHVIPTPKVILLEDDYYKQLYPSQPLLFKNRLIKVQGILVFYQITQRSVLLGPQFFTIRIIFAIYFEPFLVRES